MYPALQLTPDKSKSPKPPQDSPAKWMDQEDKRAETLTTVLNKAADELSGTSDSRLTALSEIDKIIYRRLREEYTKSNACQNCLKDTQESVDGTNDQSVKGLPYIIELINNYIEKSGDTNSGKEREKETATSDCKSKGSGGERKFQLFDQRYTVSLTKQGLIYRGLQERRSRSLKRSQEREQAIAMPDKSYSHTSK